MRAPRVTDRDEREQRYLRNIRNAKATSSCCAECGRKLAADAPVWRERFLLGVSVGLHRSRRPGMRWTTAPVCERCASVVSRTFSGPPQPCEACGRPVHQYQEHRRDRTVCCAACERVARLTATKQRRSETRGTRKCDTCGETFEPTRTDALFCSSVCRQRAYRRRKTVTDDEIDTGCAHRISRNVTDDETGTACPFLISRNDR